MSTAILKAEVQTRIDALTYPIDATVLLQSAVDTVGLDLDLTNITSVLNSSTAAIDTNTPNDDVTALNAASIALGVTRKESIVGGPEIGDYIETERAVLEDGKRLLPLDGSLIDEVEYPELAALMPITSKLTNRWAATSSVAAGSPPAVSSDGKLFYSLSKTVADVNLVEWNISGDTSWSNIYNVAGREGLGSNQVTSIALSEDNQYMYFIAADASQRIYFYRSGDGGDTFTTSHLPTVPANAVGGGSAIWCSLDGQTVIFTAVGTNSSDIEIYKSADFGVTFNLIAVDSTTFNVGSSLITSFSEDGSKLCMDMSTGIILIDTVTGTRILDGSQGYGNWIGSNRRVHINKDGTRFLGISITYGKSRRHIDVASSSDGLVWEMQAIGVPDAFSQEHKGYTWSPFVPSKVHPDVYYSTIRAHAFTDSTTDEFTSRLFSFNVVTGEIICYEMPDRVTEMSVDIITVSRGIQGSNEEYVAWHSGSTNDSAGGLHFKYGKHLHTRDINAINPVLPMDKTLKIVADPE